MSNELPPIIKKKKIVAGDGHHGGAWKVAYADFVTAMMAFFMLMWLLGATTEKQRKGIADYFNPTIPVVKASGGGSGAFGGDSTFAESSLSHTGAGPTQAPSPAGDGGQGREDEENEYAEVEDALRGLAGESTISELLSRHIITRLSDEGLVIELFESDEVTLFGEDESAEPALEQMIQALLPILDLVSNDLAIQGYTASVPIVVREDSSWDRSAARARTVQELLQAEGFPEGRIARITGFADRKPVAANPLAPRNDRVEIILLRSRL
ncbi:MAG: flagellar motor protein MotB [Pseudomonadota bacterium]